MNQTKITFIINKKPYSLSADNIKAIRDMPSADRQQLMALLEAVKHEEALSQPVDKINTNSQPAAAAYQDMLPESGIRDADAVMAQLIMEEDLNKKPPITKKTIHKWMAGFIAIVFLLVLIL